MVPLNTGMGMPTWKVVRPVKVVLSFGSVSFVDTSVANTVPLSPSGMTVVLSVELTGEKITERPLNNARNRPVPFVTGALKLGFVTGMFEGMKSAWPVSATVTVWLIVAFAGAITRLGSALTKSGGFVDGQL